MSILALEKLDGSIAKGARTLSLFVASLLLISCDGANQGVQIGNGQSPDPVAVDFPIAYIKAPLVFDEDDGLLQQTDLRELITFDFGADLYVKDRASPSSIAISYPPGRAWRWVVFAARGEPPGPPGRPGSTGP